MEPKGPFYQMVEVGYNTTNTKHYGFHPQTSKDVYFVQYRTPSDALADNVRKHPSWVDALEQRTRQAHPDAYCVWPIGKVGYLVTDISNVPDYVSEYDVYDIVTIVETGAVTRCQTTAAQKQPAAAPVRYFDPQDPGGPWYAPVQVGYMVDGYPRTSGDPWASFDRYLVQYNSRIAGLEDNREPTPSWAESLIRKSQAKHPDATELWAASKVGYLRQNLYQGEMVDYVSEVVIYEMV